MKNKKNNWFDVGFIVYWILAGILMNVLSIWRNGEIYFVNILLCMGFGGIVMPILLIIGLAVFMGTLKV
jgi:hypothetical protein